MAINYLVVGTSQPLPVFAKPPVHEVALSVMFDGLAEWKAIHTGLLWQKFRDRFPTTEDHPPLILATSSEAPIVVPQSVGGRASAGAARSLHSEFGDVRKGPRYTHITRACGRLLRVTFTFSRRF